MRRQNTVSSQPRQGVIIFYLNVIFNIGWRIDKQGRILDLKKEGAWWVQGLAPNIFLAYLGQFGRL